NITAIDDCDPMPMTICVLTGATTGNVATTQFDKGVINVICTSTDASGNMSTCSFDITVVDNEDPVINCPNDITVTIPGCDAGVNVNFPAPTFSDNCPMASYVCSHQSGDYFTCGQTVVTCTATDIAGNTSTCQFTVNVVCQCAELLNSTLTCDPDDENTQNFSITLSSLTGLPTPGNSCTATVTTTQSGVLLSNINTSWTGTQVTITGAATFIMGSCPNQLSLTANMNCVCPDGSVIDCDIPVSLAVQCCKTISIGDTLVCKNEPMMSLPLLGCNNLCDIQQVRWYIADAPCPPTSWSLFKVANNCQDLLIAPQFHNGDICVYAEVLIGPNGGPCQSVLVSDTATITLCEPVGCSVSASQNYCYVATPITPTLLTASIVPPSPNCPYTIQWWDANGPIPGETQLTYQPPALSIPTGSTVCSQSTTYILKVTSECGVSECSATITLDNDDAPLGLLEMDPLEPLPFCPGEDATMRYTPACAGNPARWDWLISTDNITFTNITTAGNQNPLYNTNRLFQDTWYRVEKQNGSCPVDQIDFYIPVNGPLTINSFTAVPAPVCVPTSVDMTVDFGPIYPSPCTYTIDWYRNGQVIHSSTASTSPANYTYTPPSADDIPGNYYVVISNSCCSESLKSSVEQVGPLCEIAIAGPCFRCNNEVVTLTGILINPMSGAICTYQWYDENGIISGATGTTLTVNPTQSGPFIFEVTCTIGSTTCIKTDTFNLKQCGFISSADEVVSATIKLFPNPVNDLLTIDFGEWKSFEGIEVYDVIGRLVLSEDEETLQGYKTLDVERLPAGLYFLKISLEEQVIVTEEFIKQ
ncbi:MAG: HYR domain-containing protein, partial [Saprospiraceae bacterium]